MRNPDGKRSPTCGSCCATGALAPQPRPGENTTIAVVATNARLTKEQASRVALMADDGLARAINPSHTIGDGDTVFALATGRWDGEVERQPHRRARRRSAVRSHRARGAQAESLGGLPSARELGTVPARLR